MQRYTIRTPAQYVGTKQTFFFVICPISYTA